jgi:hypothetical protein
VRCTLSSIVTLPPSMSPPHEVAQRSLPLNFPLPFPLPSTRPHRTNDPGCRDIAPHTSLYFNRTPQGPASDWNLTQSLR